MMDSLYRYRQSLKVRNLCIFVPVKILIKHVSLSLRKKMIFFFPVL